MEKTTAIRRIDAFASLPRDVADALAGISGLQRIGRGSTIFREGERAHFVHGIVEGRVSLVSGSDCGDTIADFLEPGDIVLVPPAILNMPYMVSGKAITDVLVLLIPATNFRELAETQLPVAAALNRLLSRHWRLLLRNLKQAKTRDADTRVAQYLLDHAPPGADAVTITLPGSRRQLAALLGMTPETLSRAFRRLGEIGVESKGRDITIASTTRLSAFAGGPLASRPAHSHAH